MLTGNLLRVKVTRSEIRPMLVKVDSPKHKERASQLLSLFEKALEISQSRKDIEGWINELSALDTDHKIFKGFAKVLLDRAEFEEPSLGVDSPPKSAQVRAEVFLLAAQKGPYAKLSIDEPRLSRVEVFTEVARKYGCSPDEIEAYLYADLRTMQRLVALRSFTTPQLLIHRYNIALCQAILLKASDLQIKLYSTPPKWLRYLFRLIKFHKLMFSMTQAEDHVVLWLDGPQSLLKQSSRYGMQLALFFPGLLLLSTPWSAQATILWNKRKKKFSIDQDCGIQSHYQKRGTWRSPAEEIFEQRFRQRNTEWELHDGEVLKLKGQRLLIPDFTAKREGKTIHIEIIGFWRKGQLSRLLKNCPENLILLVSKRLAGDGSSIPKNIAHRVVLFAEVISVPAVLEAMEKCKMPKS